MITMAGITREVITALFCGIWAAAFFVNFYNPFTALLRTVDYYIPEYVLTFFLLSSP